MKRKLLAIAATLVLSTIGMAIPAAASTHHQKIISNDVIGHMNTAGQFSGFCIDDPNNTTTNGTQQQIWSCHNVAQEKWSLIASAQGSGSWAIYLQNGMCLDDPGASTQNGTKLQVWSCLGDKAQAWFTQLLTNGDYELINWNGACIDLKNDNNSDGALLQIWTCLLDNAQIWQFFTPPTLLRLHSKQL